MQPNDHTTLETARPTPAQTVRPDSTHTAGSRNGTPQSHRRSEDRASTEGERPPDAIWKARERCRSLIKSADAVDDLPWQRLTDDPEYRADFICALFDLYRTHRPRPGSLPPSPQAYGSGLDGSEGNSGQPRDFDPCPWL